MTDPNRLSSQAESASILPYETASAYGQSIADAFTTRYGHAHRTGEVIPPNELDAWSILASLANIDEFGFLQRKIVELKTRSSQG